MHTKTLGGDLSTVMRFIEMAAESCHVDLTTLLVPGMNDTEAEIRSISAWIASLPHGNEIPLHITRFFPRCRMRDRKATDRTKVMKLTDIAKEKLMYVYPGNL